MAGAKCRARRTRGLRFPLASLFNELLKPLAPLVLGTPNFALQNLERVAGIGASAQPALQASLRSAIRRSRGGRRSHIGRADVNKRSRGSPRFPLLQRERIAGSGNRTRVASLGSWSTTTVLYPHNGFSESSAPQRGAASFTNRVDGASVGSPLAKLHAFLRPAERGGIPTVVRCPR